MTSTVSHHKQNLETYFLIWLDAAVDSAQENVKAQQQLRASINHLTTFDDDAECEEYIRSIPKDDRIVLIVSGQLGEKLVPRIHQLRQVSFIYVYCINKNRHEQWAQDFPKVQAVIIDLDDLIKKIITDQTQRQQKKIDEAFSISVFSTNAVGEGQSTSEISGQFLHSQLLIECLTRMKSNATDKDELVATCKTEYENNQVELKILKEFEENYTPSDALHWYTRQSFLYRLLNKALRVQNIDLLFLFRFFIRDIEQQLECDRCTSTIRVFRGQLMSKEEVETLQKSVGQFISINSFLSTSIDEELARSFIAGADVVKDLERVLFQIDADPRLSNIKPFADITSYSYFLDEKEVLFMIGSVFQLVRVDHNQDGMWVVRMRLSSADDHQLESLLKFLRTEYEDDERSLISFGDVLYKMGRYNDAEKYYLRCLDEGSPDERYTTKCYYSLGTVATKKGDLNSGLQWLEKSLQINMENLEPNDQVLAENYNSIGVIYRKKNDLDRAIEMFEKALNIWTKTLGDNSLRVAECYADMGCVYQTRQMFSKALDYHYKALTINENHLPKYHNHLGSAHNNIATAYHSLENYDQSLRHASVALKIFQKSLPTRHQKMGWALKNIGLVYEKQGKLQESLVYLEKALDIYQLTWPPTHYYITDVKRNIDRVSSQLKYH